MEVLHHSLWGTKIRLFPRPYRYMAMKSPTSGEHTRGPTLSPRGRQPTTNESYPHNRASVHPSLQAHERMHRQRSGPKRRGAWQTELPCSSCSCMIHHQRLHSWLCQRLGLRMDSSYLPLSTGSKGNQTSEVLVVV